jgi:two-component system, OmpR family, sensor histidine kinase KdpD
MNDDRPTPEQMLARLKAEAKRDGTAAPRGRLRLFFGYAAGIGKTYAMLQSAQAAKKEGKDIVVGYVEPHGRPETEALLAGLECLPTLTVTYRGATLHDFDLDAALSRRPEIILVDELAHTNAPGLRHAKRWQDVEELLAARIDVYSTVNVQHVESLNDIVAEISGVVVRETVPDEVFERADDVTLIDLPPDELLERLRQGKVYIPEQAAYALEKFFRKDNLVALREIALRRTADRIHEDVETARRGVAAKIPWPTNERLLVCVGPSPTSAKVVRAAKRLADRLDAPWVAVHVQTARAARMNEADRQRLHHHLRLAESLGAEIVQISGADVVDELIQYAADRNVTKIVVGKADEPPRRWFPGRLSLVERLVRDSGCIDVFVVRGLGEPVAQYVAATGRPYRGGHPSVARHGHGLGAGHVDLLGDRCVRVHGGQSGHGVPAGRRCGRGPLWCAALGGCVGAVRAAVRRALHRALLLVHRSRYAVSAHVCRDARGWTSGQHAHGPRPLPSRRRAAE